MNTKKIEALIKLFKEYVIGYVSVSNAVRALGDNYKEILLEPNQF